MKVESVEEITYVLCFIGTPLLIFVYIPVQLLRRVRTSLYPQPPGFEYRNKFGESILDGLIGGILGGATCVLMFLVLDIFLYRYLFDSYFLSITLDQIILITGVGVLFGGPIGGLISEPFIRRFELWNIRRNLEIGGFLFSMGLTTTLVILVELTI